jgi:single-strand DNA-binding protein
LGAISGRDILWRGLADLAEKYLHKGSTVYLEGKNRTRSYDDKQGIKRYVTEIMGDHMLLLDKKEP